MASTARNGNGRHRDDVVTVTPPLTELVSMLRDTQQQLVEATAAAGMYRARSELLEARVHQLEDQVLALPAPKPKTGWHRLWPW